MTTPHRSVPPPRPADELSAGYRIAESGVPDVPPRYQVLHRRGPDEQYIGMRETREEATQLAFQHHGRGEAERAATLARSVTPTRTSPIEPPNREATLQCQKGASVA